MRYFMLSLISRRLMDSNERGEVRECRNNEELKITETVCFLIIRSGMTKNAII